MCATVYASFFLAVFFFFVSHLLARVSQALDEMHTSHPDLREDEVYVQMKGAIMHTFLGHDA